MDAKTKSIIAKVTPLAQNKDHLEVIKLLKQSVQGGQKNEIILGLLASSYAETGMKEKAKSCFLEILQTNKNNYLALFQMGMLEFNDRQFSDAIDNWEAVAAQPTDFIANYWIARSYMELNSPQQAKPYIHNASNRVPARHDLKSSISSLAVNVSGEH
ncbi:MAG: hypothetical protein RPR28_10020 [Cycloclasticus sp.]|jgi:hypothetical protein